jgi:hypothetical protein
MTWCRPSVPVPLLALPRAVRLRPRWDRLEIFLDDEREIRLDYSYSSRLDNAVPTDQQAAIIAYDGLGIAWPSLGYVVTIRRLLLDARAGHAPWGDPPEVIP